MVSIVNKIKDNYVILQGVKHGVISLIQAVSVYQLILGQHAINSNQDLILHMMG